jgi:two-component system response regulator AtoC
MSSAIKPPVKADNPLQVSRLLVVSKEPGVVRALSSFAENTRWQVEIASSGWEAMERLESGAAPQLLLLDLPQGDGDSFHMLRWLRRLSPDLAVVGICDAEDATVRQEAVRMGADRILSRPLDPRQLERLLRIYSGGGDFGVAEWAGQERTDKNFHGDDEEQIDPEGFFASASPALQKLRAQAELLAQSDVPVSLVGERGSGKAAVARLIHRLSVRSGWGWQKINCAALPEGLLEEQLFGRERVFGWGNGGVNGDGHSSSNGGKEFGGRGTIFLEEITALPAALQTKLLAALENQEAVKSDSGKTEFAKIKGPLAVRVLSATSDNLERALAEGKLRQDLYRRLSAFTLQVPALRQRREEIPILLRDAMRKLAGYYGLAEREFSPAMVEACQRHHWPGNLPEFEACVKRYLVAGDVEFFPGVTAAFAISDDPANGSGHGRRHDDNKVTLNGNGNGNGNPGGNIDGLRAMEPAAALSATGAAAVSPSLKSMIQDIKCEAERKAIAAALERTGWNRKAAARLLRVSYRTLLYKIEQYRMKAAEPYFSAPGATLAVAENGGKRDGKAS